MNEMTEIKAPAKINLFLDVGEKLPNGYHLLRSVMQTVSLFDTLTLEAKKPSGGKSILLRCSDESIGGEDNIVCKAARKFFEDAGIETYNLGISLKKEIPMQAGLGGGSADAAATLRALNRLYKTGFAEERLMKIGMQVGSDVPFCVCGGTCIVEGIGEKVTKTDPMPEAVLLVAMPRDEKMSTAEAYRRIDSLTVTGNMDALISALREKDAEKIGRSMFNKFEYLMDPDSDTMKIRRIFLDHGALGARMSGSGTAVFGIFASEEDAEKAAKAASFKAKTYFCVPCETEK